MRQYLVLILFLISVEMCYGQELWKKEAIKLPPSVCYASHESHKSYNKPPIKLKSGTSKKSTIIVDYVGFPETAKLAFQFAVDIWQDLINSPVPIHIQATWTSLDTDVLGSCSPSDYFLNFNSAQIWNCYYPIALVEKMLGREVNSSTGYEIEASFNKDFTNWYFGTDGNTPTDRYDFVSTVLHELTHGLGFHGFFYSDSRGRGGYGGTDKLAAAFDQYVINKNGEKLVNTALFANPSVKLHDNLTSGWLEFNSKLDVDSFPRLYAPSTWDSGSSIYHLNDASYPTGNANSLMTHAMGMGEANHNPGPNTLAIMYDMGWMFISIKHEQLKDIEYIAPINFNAQIESDYDLDSTKLFLIYSTNKFLKKDSVRLKATSSPAIFNARITPAQNGEIQYYFSAKDVKKRTFVFPSNSPTRYLSITIGIDHTPPVITHEPIKFLLSSSLSAKIDVEATDNMGIKSVKVEYFVNDGLTINELVLVNDSADHYSGILSFPKGSVHGGDIISYKIVATDVSSQSNVGKQPLSGFNRFKIEGIYDPVDRYVTNFDVGNQDFIGSDFTISTASGFDTPALNSAHPYPSPDTDNTEFNFSTILRYPITLNTTGKMTFDEIALVEPGDVGTKFGDPNFWDYVIVEGSKDGGSTWNPFADGYDSNLQPSWLRLWNSSMSGNNSTAVPTKDLMVKHEINMLVNGNFTVGDVVLVRFRLFSDPYSHGWGWIVDNLAIQDWETAVSPVLLSSGEVSYFPNPATDQLNIQVEAKKDIRNLILKAYNSSGKLVYNQAYTVESNLFQTDIDVSRFIPGLYLFTLEPKQGQAITREIVIQ